MNSFLVLLFQNVGLKLEGLFSLTQRAGWNANCFEFYWVIIRGFGCLQTLWCLGKYNKKSREKAVVASVVCHRERQISPLAAFDSVSVAQAVKAQLSTRSDLSSPNFFQVLDPAKASKKRSAKIVCESRMLQESTELTK